ncbi:MAG: ABC transporter ATP-binding protein [Castellaniella sp.]
MPHLLVEKLNAGYGRVKVLHDISLQVGQGEMVALIGPNGAGKTTLIRAVSRLIPATGVIRFDGLDLVSMAPQAVVGTGVIQCADDRKLFPYMSVHANLMMGAYLRQDKHEIDADLQRVFDLFPVLAERRRQQAGTLSGGEQQMASIGRALMGRPRLLLLDEPSFGIAPIIVERIFEVIAQLNAGGLTVLLVEQNVTLALEMSARAYVLENGQIVLEGSSRDIAENEMVRQAYLGL